MQSFTTYPICEIYNATEVKIKRKVTKYQRESENRAWYYY